MRIKRRKLWKHGCPFDTRASQQEQGKIEIYNDLKGEIKILYKCKEVMIIPVVVGEVNIGCNAFEKWFKELKINVLVPLFQKGLVIKRLADSTTSGQTDTTSGQKDTTGGQTSTTSEQTSTTSGKKST